MKGQDVESFAGVLAQCPALAHLDLSENYNFGAAGAERLAGVLAQCPALAYLDLSATSFVEAVGPGQRGLQECWDNAGSLLA